MMLKLLDGPLSDVVYFLSATMRVPGPLRIPDGLTFDRQDESGKWVQDQYGLDDLAPQHKSHSEARTYRYGGSIELLVPKEAELVPIVECEFCGDPATRIETFDRPVHVCNQCSSEK